MAHQSKSGTSKRRELKRPQRQAKPRLEPAGRQILQQALQVAEQYPIASGMQEKTVEKAVIKLIQVYGTEVCEILLEEAAHAGSSKYLGFLTSAVFLALTRERKLKEAQRMLYQFTRSDFFRIEICGVMGTAACPEDKAEILSWMRFALPRVTDRSERNRAHLQIFSVSREPRDYLPIQQFMSEYSQRASVLTEEEVLTVLGIAAHTSDLQIWSSVIDIMARVGTQGARAVGDQMLYRMLEMLSRENLHTLAELVSDTPYVERIRTLALQARSSDEVDEPLVANVL